MEVCTEFDRTTLLALIDRMVRAEARAVLAWLAVSEIVKCGSATQHGNRA